VDEELRALFDENRRLRTEVRLLNQQVEAFERSRWWRAHPRFLLRRSGDGDGGNAAEASTGIEVVHDDSIATRFRDEVLVRGDFSRDSLTNAVAGLDPLVVALAGRKSRILEIGSFEGMSACYFLWRLPDTHVTCVDTFLGNPGSAAREHPGLEPSFDRNVALVDANRVRKIVGASRHVLVDLLDERAEFDLVYVDGSHLGLDVLVDAALSWRLLRSGGTLVFDDYAWNDRGEDPLLRPGPAIDAVLSLLAGKYELLSKDAQVAVRKL
jgi:SAM-dependent methyltransferase